MEKKVRIHMEVEKNGKIYSFSAPAGSPFGEAHDALYDFLQEIINLAQESMKNVEPKAGEDKKA